MSAPQRFRAGGPASRCPTSSRTLRASARGCPRRSVAPPLANFLRTPVSFTRQNEANHVAIDKSSTRSPTEERKHAETRRDRHIAVKARRTARRARRGGCRQHERGRGESLRADEAAARGLSGRARRRRFYAQG